MKLKEIKAFVNYGFPVYWKSKIYEIKEYKGEYYIHCLKNDSIIGLTWEDGITLNGEEGDFFTSRQSEDSFLLKLAHEIGPTG